MQRGQAKDKDAAAGTGSNSVAGAGAGKARSRPADFGGSQPAAPEDQAERQGFGRQRLDPQDQPPADVRDRENVAGEKDFELGPGGKP
jgi:hypothetical protein